MFPRRERLPRAAFPPGGGARRLSSEHISAITAPQGRGIAVVISKKTLRRAVDRHLLKRRILGALRRPPALKRPSALVLYPRASALTLAPAELRAELAALLSKCAG
ncbi:MAG: ribonuclease P protein component [Patescibacteria group bacterium]|nr:ribonuclease P protein component [Patescibacteria group bacterium]MDE1944063.1 ribonuclease P protein component [Patescibacteria group bacterium]MDE1944724.1 ribonuclease P protein component [Patescibacteria group bacterium]MDE2057268.1 ribonuclease P protein component [Patescibacteria group bacterium]